MAKIYAELSRIQKGLKAPKSKYNSFGKYYYRSAEDILESVKPMLSDGLSLIINDEPVTVGERYYIRATVTLTNGDESVSAVAYAREDAEKKGMDGCQLTGACSSYARKYALNALLMIDDSKDSDDDSLSPKNPANNQDEQKEQKDFTPPPAAKGTVSNAGTLPPVAPPAPPAPPAQPQPTEAMVYLMKAIKQLREDRKISATQNNKLFADQFAALVNAGLAPNKRKEEYTLAEAEALIDAMYKNFPTKSAELKRK